MKGKRPDYTVSTVIQTGNGDRSRNSSSSRHGRTGHGTHRSTIPNNACASASSSDMSANWAISRSLSSKQSEDQEASESSGISTGSPSR